MYASLADAVRLFADRREKWQSLMRRGMIQYFSWRRAAAE
jgi:glycogen synthase